MKIANKQIELINLAKKYLEKTSLKGIDISASGFCWLLNVSAGTNNGWRTLMVHGLDRHTAMCAFCQSCTFGCDLRLHRRRCLLVAQTRKQHI